ncbi:MAG: hypothetical protein R3245_11780 [Kiloniellales bacterium]|nr:hypothetical protein [Kiloniellales bacterium]
MTLGYLVALLGHGNEDDDFSALYGAENRAAYTLAPSTTSAVVIINDNYSKECRLFCRIEFDLDCGQIGGLWCTSMYTDMHGLGGLPSDALIVVNQINSLQAELVLRNAKVVGSTPIGSTNSLKQSLSTAS